MNDLRITIIQSNLHWENIDENLEMFEEKIGTIPDNSTDLIVLPEMFTTGFTMNAYANFELSEGSKTLDWMYSIAVKKNCVITGSFIIKQNHRYYNRLIWMRPGGMYDIYNKRHLFSLAKENETYSKGYKRLVVELNGWKICPMICYDLRFPVWSRNQKDYDVLIYIANWPEKRVYAWKHLLIARAIENQSYVIGANRVGEDGNGFIYSGDSVALNYKGESFSNIIPHKEMIETVTLSYKDLEEFRTTFPFALDADNFTINL